MLKTFEVMSAKIQDEIYAMGQKVVVANEISLEAISSGDVKLFSKAKSELNNISHMSNKIDNLILRALALHQPEARDLRSMVSYLKMTNEIVRAGTNTKSFIKNFSKSLHTDIDFNNILEFSIPLQKASIAAIKTSIEIIKMDTIQEIEKSYQRVLVEESKTDDLYAMIEKNLLKKLSNKVELSKDYLDILSSLRRLEKIADRAASIANLLIFAHLGGELHQA
ncbi:PhoU family transcriptional regulator [Arcobacter sp. 31_11_sub10_T18]|nr:PhoU family transcriptional regulator [Arcobacter sp. 31_11_sub10_T18]